mgnify:CR=1 FL=1
MEKASWENAKRLAAILCIVIEECGESNENIGEKERAENVVLKGDKETYQEVVDFLEQQKDTLGKTLINEIFRFHFYYFHKPIKAAKLIY